MGKECRMGNKYQSMPCEALLLCNIYSILPKWKVEMKKGHVGLPGLSVMLCPVEKRKSPGGSLDAEYENT